MSHTLHDELTAGPLAAELAPLIAAGDDAGIVARLNAPSLDAVGGIDRAAFAIWAGRTGLRAAIQDHATNPASPLRSSALTLIDFLMGGVSPSLDMSRPENQAMLAGWQQAGAITPAQRDELLALATQPISRARQAGLGTVSEVDVRRVLWTDDGSKRL